MHAPLSLLADRRRVEAVFLAAGAERRRTRGGHAMLRWEGRSIPLGHSSGKELPPMVARRLSRTFCQVSEVSMGEYVRRLRELG